MPGYIAVDESAAGPQTGHTIDSDFR